MLDENKKAKRLSQKVRTLRAKYDMTQGELARKAGISIYTITFLERKNRVPRASTLVKIAKAFEIDPEELLKYAI